jgi:hypothetical protein
MPLMIRSFRFPYSARFDPNCGQPSENPHSSDVNTARWNTKDGDDQIEILDKRCLRFLAKMAD